MTENLPNLNHSLSLSPAQTHSCKHTPHTHTCSSNLLRFTMATNRYHSVLIGNNFLCGKITGTGVSEQDTVVPTVYNVSAWNVPLGKVQA